MSTRGRKNNKTEEVQSDNEENMDSGSEMNNNKKQSKNVKGGKKNSKSKEVQSEAEDDAENSGSEMSEDGGKQGKNTKNNLKGGKKPAPSRSKSKTPQTAAKRGAGSKGRGKKAATTKQTKGSKTAKKGRGSAKENDRYFKLIDAKTGRSYGRYTGDTPKQAASKGFTKMLQKMKVEGKTPPKQSTTIYLRESTRGSARKIYGYEASRLKLPKPQKLVITDKETNKKKTIVYHYRNKIKKVPVPEQIGGAKTLRSKKAATKSSPKKKTQKSKTTNAKSSGKSSGKASQKITNNKSSNKKSSSRGSSGPKKGSTGKSTPVKKGVSAKASTSN